MSDLGFDRYDRAFHRVTVDQVWELRRAIVGPANMPPGKQAELAKKALESIRAGRLPTPKEYAALELIVRLMRPSLLSVGRAIDDLPPEASSFGGWDEFRTRIRPSLYTIGRVDDATGEGVGTGFLVSSTLLVTNRHVLDQLSSGSRRLERGQASVRFVREFKTIPDEAPIAVVGVAAVHGTLDLALLEIDPVTLGDDRTTLQIAEEEAQGGDAIVALGYPQQDSLRNPMFISAIFGNRFGVKRVAPGEVVEAVPGAFQHDCSTLGGNSGSPVVSIATGRVVGVHCAGKFMYRNESVPAAITRPGRHPGPRGDRPWRREP
jgi:S1-C subfamily serine protease